MMDMSITMPRKAAKFWWNLKRENKISIPPDVAYYTKKTPYDDWKATTWRDVFAVRKCVCKINGYGELEDIAFDFKDFKNE